MRCRKARSFLSAYCHDEIDGKIKLALEEHLSDCSSCRKEEAVFRSLNKEAAKVDSLKVTKDFNNILLNRIANERFAETRSKAYLPKPAPVITWMRAVPAFASVCIIIFAAVAVFNPGSPDSNDEMQTIYSNVSSLDNTYLTVQPTDNPNMTQKLDKNWSLVDALAKSDRLTRFSNSMQPTNRFNSSSLSLVSSQKNSPFASNYYRVRPIVRIYVAPKSTTVKEGMGVY